MGSPFPAPRLTSHNFRSHPVLIPSPQQRLSEPRQCQAWGCTEGGVFCSDLLYIKTSFGELTQGENEDQSLAVPNAVS